MRILNRYSLADIGFSVLMALAVLGIFGALYGVIHLVNGRRLDCHQLIKEKIGNPNSEFRTTEEGFYQLMMYEGDKVYVRHFVCREGKAYEVN